MFGFERKKAVMPTAESALAGRDHPIATAESHYVYNRPLTAEPQARQKA